MKIYQSKRRKFKVVEKPYRNGEKKYQAKSKHLGVFSFLFTGWTKAWEVDTLGLAITGIKNNIIFDNRECRGDVIKERVL